MTTSTHDVAGPCAGFEEGEEPVTEGSERWFRACNDDSLDDQTGQPTNLMFGLSSGDDGRLSGTLASKTTSEKTASHLRDVQKRSIAAMREVSVSDLTAADLHLHDDSAVSRPPQAPEGHAYLDLQHLPLGRQNPAKRARERVRALLFERSRTAE